jgi:hypothetical protein
MKDSAPTMDWPLDAADEPGKADAEIGIVELERLPATGDE